MRRHISNGSDDRRTIDLAILIVLLAFVISAYAVVTDVSRADISPTTIGTDVRW